MNPGQSVSSANILNDEKLTSQISNSTAMKRTNLSDSTDSLQIKRTRLDTYVDQSNVTESESLNHVNKTISLQNHSHGSLLHNDVDLKNEVLMPSNLQKLTSMADFGANDNLKYSPLVTNLKTEYHVPEDISSISKSDLQQSTSDTADGIELLLLHKAADYQHDNSQLKQISDNTTIENTDVTPVGNAVRLGNYNLNRLTVASKVVSRLKMDSNIKNQSLMITTKKISPDVPQTTAKVAIGNTTISVPLLKPINSTQIVQSQNPNRDTHKQMYPTLPVSKILNVKQKAHPTIVSLSIKPVTTKIVNAKVVSKKLSPTTSALSINFPQKNEISQTKTTLQSKMYNQNNLKKKSALKHGNEIADDDSYINNSAKVTKVIENPLNPKNFAAKEMTEDPSEVRENSEGHGTSKNPSFNIITNMINSNVVLKKDAPPFTNAEIGKDSKDTITAIMQCTVDTNLKAPPIINIKKNVSYVECTYQPEALNKSNVNLNSTDNIDHAFKKCKDSTNLKNTSKESMINELCESRKIASPNLENIHDIENIDAEDMLTSINVIIGTRADNVNVMPSNFESTAKNSEFSYELESGTGKVEKISAGLDKLKSYPSTQLLTTFSNSPVSRNNILAAKSEDNQNALLKQLLQNSSNCQSNKILKTPIKTNSPPVTSSTSSMCNQLISSRKVINVRAPSLGLVSSLEAQLARPVIPPVTTNLISPHDGGIKLSTHSTTENQILNKNGLPEELTLNQCNPKQIVSKETSFISNPNLNPCLSKSNQKPTESEQNQIHNPDEIQLQKFEKTEAISMNYKEIQQNINQKLNPSMLTIRNNKYNGNQNGRYQNIGTYDNSITSNENKLEMPTKIIEAKFNIYEKCDAEKNNFNKNISDENNCLSPTKGSTSPMQIKNFDDINKKRCPTKPASDSLYKDNKPNLINTIKNENIRKKRKRDNQKLRRPIVKNNKESVLTTLTNSFPCQNQKRKVKKILKIDEDYDHYIDKVMVHMRNMDSIEILEPLLDSNFAIGRFYERSNKLNNINDFDDQCEDPNINNNFGTTKFPMMKDFYDTDSIKKTQWENNKTTIMHNEFYDQEFCSFIKKNDYNKLAKIIRQISTQQRNGSVTIKNTENSNNINFLNTSSIKMVTFPGMLLKNNNRGNSIDRMSPTIPHVNNCDNNVIATNSKAAMKENIHFYEETILNSKERYDTHKTVIISLPLKAESNIFAVLKDLANILNIIPPHTFRVLKTGYHKTLKENEFKNKKSHENKKGQLMTSVSLQNIFNGRNNICRNCGKTVNELGIRLFQCIPNLLYGKKHSKNIYLCNKLCMLNYKEQQKNSSNLERKCVFKTPLKLVDNFNNIDSKKVKHHQYTNDELVNTDDLQNDVLSMELINENIITPKNYVENYDSEESLFEIYSDNRQCSFCNQIGDGDSNGPSRLLNYDNDKWVHLNCALWSNCVYETVSGSLMNFQNALDMSFKQHCSGCQDLGATVKCCKSRCSSIFHLPCAIKAQCVFFKNKSIVCQHHSSKLEKENELASLNVERRVYIERCENIQTNSAVINSDQVLRIGSLTFLSVGHLFPNQVEHFHSANHVYPVGYKSIRFYWSMKRPNKRCRYICSISEVDGRPEFSIKVQEPMESESEIREASADAAWNQILKQISELRKKNKMIELHPQFLTGDDLFGLTEPNVVRIIENLPGVETLSNYRFKYGRLNFQDSPLPINSTGAARTEPKHHQLINYRKPHTQRTCSVYNQRDVHSTSSVIAGEVACPYSKQFVHSKSSQYKKMKQEWRNNVFLARSKIQGLGLYAARDIEKHTMIIEYIGEIIRTEVSEIREKQYEAKNRGIYMFRLDEDRVVDATLCGGLARYINHSCNPNCVTETVDVDREHRIIIFAKRKICRGEELCYDYKFDIEDDANKLACMCTASNCRKWMN